DGWGGPICNPLRFEEYIPPSPSLERSCKESRARYQQHQQQRKREREKSIKNEEEGEAEELEAKRKKGDRGDTKENPFVQPSEINPPYP
ncbi:unnamed protein product, partial [Orchesella dallaii]